MKTRMHYRRSESSMDPMVHRTSWKEPLGKVLRCCRQHWVPSRSWRELSLVLRRMKKEPSRS